MEIAQVGTVSANNDRTIGEIIAEAMEKVARKALLLSKRPRAWKRRLTSWKACSLTADT